MKSSIRFAFVGATNSKIGGFVRVDLFSRDSVEAIGPMEWVFGGSEFDACQLK